MNFWLNIGYWDWLELFVLESGRCVHVWVFFLFSLYFLICFAAALRKVSLKKYQELSICWSVLDDLVNLKEIRCDWIVSLNLFQFSVVVLAQLNLLLGCLSLGDCVPWVRGQASIMQDVSKWSVERMFWSIGWIFAWIRSQQGDGLIQIWSILLQWFLLFCHVCCCLVGNIWR